MGLIKGLLYWGYVDADGVITVKRYINDRAIENTERMPWCKGIFDPFEAIDFKEARHKCHAIFEKEKN